MSIVLQKVGNFFKPQIWIRGVLVATTVEAEEYDLAWQRAVYWARETGISIIKKEAV